MDRHVFICYSRDDGNFVLELAANLKRKGVPVWLDQWDIPPGADWNRTIEMALNDCTHLIFVLSPSSVESDVVRDEWLSALDKKKVVIPILYQRCQMPFRLKQIQNIDFTSRSPDDERSLGQVLKALEVQRELAATDWLDKGAALFMQGKYHESIKAYDKVIEINPLNKDAMDAWKGKSPALEALGKYDEAIEAGRKALAILCVEQGIQLKKSGRNSEAKAAFAKAEENGYPRRFLPK